MATWMDEYIKREDVLRAYEEEQRRNGSWRFETLIGSVPSADVEPVKYGKWIFDAGVDYCYKCSECQSKKPPHYVSTNYCSNCGAKMDGE